MNLIAIQTNLFSEAWHEHDIGGELLCTNARTLIDYTCSAGAKAVDVSSISLTGVPAVTVKVTGPKCDDGTPLWTRYRLTRSEFLRLPEGTQRRFARSVEKLAGPKGPSLNFYAALKLEKPK